MSISPVFFEIYSPKQPQLYTWFPQHRLWWGLMTFVAHKNTSKKVRMSNTTFSFPLFFDDPNEHFMVMHTKTKQKLTFFFIVLEHTFSFLNSFFVHRGVFQAPIRF